MRRLVIISAAVLAMILATAAPVAAGTTTRVKDIVPGKDGSDPHSFTRVAGTIVFNADDALWKTDGTSAGTKLVKSPSSGGPQHVGGLTNVAGIVYFAANGYSPVTGREPWKTQGDATSTKLIKDIAPGTCFGLRDPFPCSSNPRSFTGLDGAAYFGAQFGLWKSDGTEPGTSRVQGGGGIGSELVKVDGAIYFQGRPSSQVSNVGSELFKTDGTDAGTVLVKDIKAGRRGSYPSSLTKVGDTLFFAADDGRKLGRDHNEELWKSDGTGPGTKLVKDIRRGTCPWANSSRTILCTSRPEQLTNVGGTLFFSANDGKKGRELWKSDGTAAGTKRVKDIRPGPKGSGPTWLTAVGDRLYFTAHDGRKGRELWTSDGTAAGTKRVRDIRRGPKGANPRYLTRVGDRVYFNARNWRGRELWSSAGTARSTKVVKDIRPGRKSGNPEELTGIDGTLYFNAVTFAHGRELWKHVP